MERVIRKADDRITYREDLGSGYQGRRWTIHQRREDENSGEIAFSLYIAIIVGGVAGVLVAVSSTKVTLDKSTIIALIAAGYAGTGIIEGLLLNVR